MEDFIRFLGNRDIQSITIEDGEYYRQQYLGRGNRPATVAKKFRHLERLLQLAIERG